MCIYIYIFTPSILYPITRLTQKLSAHVPAFPSTICCASRFTRPQEITGIFASEMDEVENVWENHGENHQKWMIWAR